MLKLVGYRNIIESIFSLSLLNLINIALPLVTLPYLIKTVGIGNYGKYSIVYTMLQYIVLISAYGFNFSVTRQVSINRDNHQKIDEIFNSTIISRLLLSIVPILFLVPFSYIVFGRDYCLMMLFGLGIVLGDILNPIWLFQGMEKMRYMTIVNFVSKVLFTILIFYLIKDVNDSVYITLYNSAGYICAGLLSIYIAKREFNIHFQLPKRAEIMYQIKDGWYVFLSTIFMNLYRNSNTFILGLFVNEAAVGIYSGAEKIIKAIQSVVEPIPNALFPHLAEKFKEHSPKENITKLLKVAKLLFVLLLLLSVGCFLMAPLLNKWLLDNQEEKCVLLICMMSPIILIGGFNYLFGIVGLINLRRKKEFLKSVVISGVLSLLFLLLTVNWWGVISASLSMLLAESVILICCIYYLKDIYGSNNLN